MFAAEANACVGSALVHQDRHFVFEKLSPQACSVLAIFWVWGLGGRILRLGRAVSGLAIVARVAVFLKVIFEANHSVSLSIIQRSHRTLTSRVKNIGKDLDTGNLGVRQIWQLFVGPS